MLESKVEKHLVEKVKDLGGLCYKFVSPNCAGVPDRIVIFSGDVYFVELKAPKEQARKLQLEVFKRIVEQGVPVYLLDSIEDVDRFVKELRR